MDCSGFHSLQLKNWIKPTKTRKQDSLNSKSIQKLVNPHHQYCAYTMFPAASFPLNVACRYRAPQQLTAELIKKVRDFISIKKIVLTKSFLKTSWIVLVSIRYN